MKQKMFFTLTLFLSACQATSESSSTRENTLNGILKNGVWRAELTLRKKEPLLPFNFEVSTDNEGNKIVKLMNEDERIELGTVQYKGDTLVMPMKVFNTEIIAKVNGDELIGEWVKNDFEDYRLPFKASYNNTKRFIIGTGTSGVNLAGNWAVSFENKEGSIEEAIGIFNQLGNSITGTFLTQTGDYRFLQGNIDGNKFKLSCFDGEHAFLFHASITNENTLTDGTFWSGKHWKQAWSAVKDANATLPDASTLTYLKEGYETVAFEFQDIEGNTVALSDKKFEGKVVVIQLMGSWCPNCLDESKFLAPMYKNRKEEGLEVIALCYERLKDREKIAKRLNILKDRIGIEYPLLIAGSDDKLDAVQTLPMLNHILAFPTTIFVDRMGKVRKIHTGFSGPGTGKHYDQFTREFNLFVDKLLLEEAL